MNETHLYYIQILFVAGVAIGAQVLYYEDNKRWLNIGRYIVYILTLRAVPPVCRLAQEVRTGKLDLPGLLGAARAARDYALVYAAAVALLLLQGEKILTQDFVFLALGYLVVKYPEMANKPMISYGVGMACSFFEGYLVHVIPSDGASFVGFEENIVALEDRHGVLFPVKKLFIIITKSMYCPPDLKEFNRGTDVPYMEAFDSIPDVVRSVAGVRNRSYRNTAYKVYRPAGAPPLCLAAECATPLHTLQKVLNNRSLYQEIAEIDVTTVVNDFCTTLQKILDKSPQCRGKCELVFYDHEDPTQNLAEILVSRVRQLDSHFEQKILARRDQNVLEPSP